MSTPNRENAVWELLVTMLTKARAVGSALLISVCSIALAQPQDRLAAPIDGGPTVLLRGSRNPRVASTADEGPLADNQMVHGVQLRFKPTAAQTAALTQLLEDQRNPASPLYHAWLTPEDFGERFGLSRKDLDTVRDWSERQGFRIDAVARSRTFITLSATAGQIRDTFQTEVHRYRADGRMHFANVTEARIPASLEPLIFNIAGLDDFELEDHPALKPNYNRTDGRHTLAPGDLATIYNLTPVHERGLNGSGQRIAIAGRTDIHMEDVQNYRLQFGLPKNDPLRILVPGYSNPGTDDDLEALLDVEIAGASAPNATILYVYAYNHWAAVMYAIDENLAPVLSTSFGVCEPLSFFLGTVELLRFIAQQANAQGITWVAGSGDSGAAACEPQVESLLGVSGIAVNVPASLPEVTGVGGTEFAEGAARYWSDTPGTNLSTALSYIPEVAWNDTAMRGGLFATGGGVSVLYPKPAWQTGPGVPDDNARHVPDIAFSASADHDGYQIMIHGNFHSIGGTSAPTPFFAGVLALLNQQVVKSGLEDKPGLGNINPRLYQLAQTAPDVFHDITSGDNIVPCKPRSPDCGPSGSYGHQAGPGYDHPTGLGSIDVDKLLRNWAK